MSYLEAVKQALCSPWFYFIRKDAKYGNGFEIAAYGLTLIGRYLLIFTLRLLVAVLFPLSALIIMRVHAANERYQQKINEQLDEDL